MIVSNIKLKKIAKIMKKNETSADAVSNLWRLIIEFWVRS